MPPESPTGDFNESVSKKAQGMSADLLSMPELPGLMGIRQPVGCPGLAP